jgi:hypothetical protein
VSTVSRIAYRAKAKVDCSLNQERRRVRRIFDCGELEGGFKRRGESVFATRPSPPTRDD